MLHIDTLSAGYRKGHPVVRCVDLEISAGQTVALVGESGSGKSTIAKVLLGLMPTGGWATGSARFHDTELIGRAEADWRGLRGARIGIVPQGAMSGLSPVHRIESQLIEAIQLHTNRTTPAARARDLMELVQLDPSALAAYPHQLSGGMRQRVAIALALAGEPELVVADEPTTGLDLLTQERILELLAHIRSTQDVAMLVISHDLPGLLGVADQVAVMYAGAVVELRLADALNAACAHPYTKGLLAASASVRPETAWSAIPGSAPPTGSDEVGCRFAPRCPLAIAHCHEHEPVLTPDSAGKVACHRAIEKIQPIFPRVPVGSAPVQDVPVVQAVGLRVSFRSRRRSAHALRGVDLHITRGEILGLVGESGSGKTTLARVMLGLQRPSDGAVRVNDVAITALSGRALRAAQRRIGFVHQDPYGSLHPAMNVSALVAEPLVLAGAARGGRLQKVRQALDAAGLPTDSEFLARLPSRLSGGQRQRVAIARALVTDPLLLIADEATSMLDVSTRAGIAITLRRLATERGLAILFITHDLGEAMHACDRVMVLRDGELVEAGPPAQLAAGPAHPYTAELLDAGRRRALPSTIP